MYGYNVDGLSEYITPGVSGCVLVLLGCCWCVLIIIVQYFVYGYIVDGLSEYIAPGVSGCVLVLLVFLVCIDHYC